MKLVALNEIPPEPVRQTFVNIPPWAQVVTYVAGALACLVFAYGVFRHVQKWRLGRPDKLSWSWGRRIQALLQYAVAQMRVVDDRYAGAMHLAIFWGMVVLALATAVATVDWDITYLLMGFQFLKGRAYLVYELMADLFGVALLVGLALAFCRRYVMKPKRLETVRPPTFGFDSGYLLLMLLGIAVTGFLTEAARLAAQNLPWSSWSFGGHAVAGLFQGASPAALAAWHHGLWAVHAVLSLVFIASIPFSKAFHMVSSAVSIFLRRLGPPGALVPAAADAGVERVSDLSWRQLAQVDGCTWCGRCQDACPAYLSGQPLSPKNIVLRLNGAMLSAAKANGNGATAARLHGEIIAAGELWACTTCLICEQVCPVFIEQPRLIVDLRRHLVSQGQVEKGPRDALTKLQRYGNSFGLSDRMRARWTQGLDFKIKDARKEPVEYLWFVGDYASYDARVQDITRATARILQRAGVDCGIAYEGERNAGNDVRRLGEEGLFEVLRDKNLDAFSRVQWKNGRRIVFTTDPHSYNTLKNEYQFSGDSVAVKHAAEPFAELIQRGQLVMKQRLTGRVTFHDPCYLGRHNGVYDPPRRVLQALGVEVVEMPRTRDRSHCCGAGGGRIWMEDTPGIKERPAENRVREAAALPGVATMVVACPKDVAMFRDAVKTTGNEGKFVVKDLAELVWAAAQPTGDPMHASQPPD